MRAHLTDASVRALKHTEKQTKVWDLKTPGFGIRINGRSKTWFVMFGQKRSLKTLGRYPAVPLADARKAAQRVLGGLSEQEAEERTPTFGKALAGYLEQHYKGKRPRTAKEARRLLEKHFLPKFEKSLVGDLTDQKIGKELDKLDDTPSEKLHAFRALRTFLRWCTRPPRRYIRHSPLEGYEAPGKDRKGSRTLSDEELVKVWRARDDAAGDYVRLLILWGTRNLETAKIEPAWVRDGIVTIPGEFTKNHRPHTIPVCPMAQQILDRKPNAGSYYFPGKNEDCHLTGWSALKKTLDKRSGVTGWQMRDIRRTFRSNMAKLKVSREIGELLLNHITGAEWNDLDEIYNQHTYIEEKREALLKWEGKLTELLARQ